MAILNFFLDVFGKKRGVGGGVVALQSFWSLKKDTRTFHFRSNESSLDLLGPLVPYDQPWKKKIQTNKHPSVTILLAKKRNFHIFVDRKLIPL